MVVSVSQGWSKSKSSPTTFLRVFKESLVWVLALVSSCWVLGRFPELGLSKPVFVAAAAVLASSVVVGKLSRLKSQVVEVEVCPSQDLRTDSFSGSECINPSASEDSEGETDWGHERDWSEDGLLTDEESLIEIAIPSGHYIGCGRKEEVSEIGDVNEEENLIEIDISMGSIKSSVQKGNENQMKF